MQNNQLNTAGLRIRRTPRQVIAWVIIVPFLLMPADGLGADEPPSAMALVRGVEASRTRHDSLKATLEIRYLLPAPAKTINCLVEMDGAKRRFEVFAGEVPGQVIIRDGDEFHGYRRVKHADVDVYDTERATGVRGDVAFDPRILGLSDTMSCDLDIKTCLWYEKSDSIDVVGQETLNGVDVWRVRAKRGNSTAEFWIEEPSFRVHRKTVETPYMRIELDSEFDEGVSPSPFPSRVIAKRTFKQSDHTGIDRTYIVKSFDFGAVIPAERFTLTTIDLPMNTMINDYRISRIVGYWNGEGISKNPVYKGERPSLEAIEPPEGSGRRWVFILSGILILVVIVLLVRRYQGAKA